MGSIPVGGTNKEKGSTLVLPFFFVLESTRLPLSLQIFVFTRKMQIILCNNSRFLNIYKNNRYLHQFNAQLKPVFCISPDFLIFYKVFVVKKTKNIKNANLRFYDVKQDRVSSFTVLWILINTIKGLQFKVLILHFARQPLDYIVIFHISLRNRKSLFCLKDLS